MKILAVTQARYGSTRLPAKILKEVNGTPLLEIHLRRILLSKRISALKIATTPEEGSAQIVAVPTASGFPTAAAAWTTCCPASGIRPPLSSPTGSCA